MRPTRHASVAIVALIAAAVSCSPKRPAEPDSEAERRLEQLSPQIGDSCNHDRDCTAPLRCIDGACAEPPAMMGTSSDDTPMVLFYGDNGEALFFVEVADDPQERERGLMYRHHMADDWGMIFVYPNEQPLSFWMRNTYIPLDMVFLSSDGVVVGVVGGAEPLTTVSRAVDGMSRFVVELNAGKAAEVGIRAGVRCELLNFPPGVIDTAANH